MNVAVINGSPKSNGNTALALHKVMEALEKGGVDCKLIHVGNQPVRGCTACGQCGKNKDEQCIQKDDPVNEWIQDMKAADGILVGSPVYYSGMAGTLKCFLDRAFFVAGANGGLFRHKVGAGLVVARRSGGTAAFDQLNKYFLISEMMVPGSNYWNVGHGGRPGEISQDEEAMQIMEVLGENMAWLIQSIHGSKDVVTEPPRKPKTATNFVR
jgi:multimeric flavodoxin WrbA